MHALTKCNIYWISIVKYSFIPYFGTGTHNLGYDTHMMLYNFDYYSLDLSYDIHVSIIA